jgi:hypothetical protein
VLLSELELYLGRLVGLSLRLALAFVLTCDFEVLGEAY